MTVKARITTSTVLRALYHLGYNHAGVKVTTEDVAGYLEADQDDVRHYLRDLEARRFIRRRQRDGEQVWHPWEGQR